MSELKFSGTATLTGFPRDRSFNFELDGPDRLVIKAGKEVFLVIEKEAAPAVEAPSIAPTALASLALPVNIGAFGGASLDPVISEATVVQSGYLQAATQAPPVNADGSKPGEVKTRKPRGPNVVIDDNAIIVIDPNRANPYSKLRGKYYETLKTAHGRTVGWWKETSMVKSLEGSPPTLLKFFLSENVLQLHAPVTTGQPVQQAVQSNIVPIQPSQQPVVAGPMWTPPSGGAQPGQSGGPSFLG